MSMSQLAEARGANTRAEQLREQPFTLVLSAGFFGFFAHTGILAALEEFELEPDRIVGASAGALAGGLWAAGLSAAELQDELAGLERRDFWDPGLPLGGLLKGRRFEAMLSRMLSGRGIRYFEDCQRPFSAVVFDLIGRQTTTIDRGHLVPAIRASCAVPLMFRPVRVGWRYYVDGGLKDRAALSMTEQDEYIVHHELPTQSAWSGLSFREAGRSKPAHHLTISSLPRLGPFRLRRGMEAVEHARQQARNWLTEPV
tara:strand:+ start:272 stop:1039 length:768 start_codon:yes stop_codon:yes gene_type:complete